MREVTDAMGFPLSRRFAAAFCLFAPVALALDAPRKIVDYDIRVSLDPKEKRVEGSETLKWTNPSSDRVPDLKFHLYWNGFRNDRSTFFKESGGQLRGDEADKEAGWGYTDVTSMTWNGVELKDAFRFESPDDGNPDDRTVLSVSLPRPVEPGETITLEIKWKARPPKVFARAGYVRDFFFFGQWYPKIGVYEPVGRRRRTTSGWNCHQYHANSEFYADWGDYKVAITVPENFVVASAGRQVDEKKAGGRKTLTFVQESIHDFAWTTDPRYVVKTFDFDPSRDVPAEEFSRASRILGRSVEDLRRGWKKQTVRVYMQPDHLSQWERYADAQRWALVWFGLYAFPYPYDQISIIDPPEDGIGAGGMEYQTLYTAGTYRLLGMWPFQGLRFQETVVIHEFGHGYWYGLLASNEFEESWMDEGINSFTEYEMTERRYRYQAEFPWKVGFGSWDIGRLINTNPDFDPIVTNSWGFATGNSYGRNSYPRTATVLDQIRRLAGEERFWRAFRAYSERWRFDHPTSEDFFEALDRVLDPSAGVSTAGSPAPTASGGLMEGTRTLRVDVARQDFVSPSLAAPAPPRLDRAGYRALVNKTFYGTGFVDFKIIAASTNKAEDFSGWNDAGKPVGFDPAGPKKKKRDRKKDEAGKEENAARYDTRVVVGRDGDIVLPVEIVLTFANGKTHHATWDGKSKWLRLSTTYASRLTKVEVDPRREIVLDRDPWNNARYLDKWTGPSAAKKFRVYAFHLGQILLSTAGLLF